MPSFTSHTRIGRLALLQGGCAVSRDVPPFLIASLPTNEVAAVNTVGLRGPASIASR
jgi:UDP-N-acetylglucosamine acyltransferase